ncbi:MAG: DUF4071 domain-containing protein [bacterium]|nr:DUF4071 domain-containing protein [bacterium]
MTDNDHKKTCFVVMGFGTKTDFEQQKTFDLDKSYRIIIKPAVEAAGLECVRADEVMHSGVIDKPMYEQLLQADVVVADLSTSNANAIYELGVRHALRRNTTVTIAESGFKFPFDIGHLLVRGYQHLGVGIDAEDAEKFRTELTKALRELTEELAVDSPVYTFLPGLNRPTLGKPAVAVAQPVQKAVPLPENQSVGMLMDMYRAARADSNWGGVKTVLGQVRASMPNDPFVLQQLALATYKDKSADERVRYEDASKVLAPLDPNKSQDPETVGLWGAIHKRLWELTSDRAALETSIRSYGRGFQLKDDHYNGINYAFMLDTRAAVSDDQEDAVADHVWARRVRRRVVEICEQALASDIKDDDGNADAEAKFWLEATLVEAMIGTGDARGADKLASVAESAPEDWMADTLKKQVGKLEGLMAPGP